jgi:hypothetical protein
MDEILKLISIFESRIATQWQYDTRLDYQDDYITSSQEAKCDAHAAATKQARQDLIDAISALRGNDEND